eukprot:1625537-Prymnesium_polylepis.2
MGALLLPLLDPFRPTTRQLGVFPAQHPMRDPACKIVLLVGRRRLPIRLLGRFTASRQLVRLPIRLLGRFTASRQRAPSTGRVTIRLPIRLLGRFTASRQWARSIGRVTTVPDGVVVAGISRLRVGFLGHFSAALQRKVTGHLAASLQEALVLAAALAPPRQCESSALRCRTVENLLHQPTT